MDLFQGLQELTVGLPTIVLKIVFYKLYIII